MSDPRRPDGSDPYRGGWSQPTQPMGDQNAPYPDPAYAGPYSYPSYAPNNPTQQLPPYWTQTQQPMQQPPEPPEPRSPRWLWLAAGTAVLIVVGLVIALVINETNSKESTFVAPLPPVAQEPTTPTPTRAPPPIPRTTTATPTPTTSIPLLPPTTTVPGVSEPVVYTVDGVGRAISITYVDAGGVLQMEFNVVLPWTKEVSLSSPALNAASVTVLNVGREVTCTVSVDGEQVRKRTGTGLTICASAG
ncbi:hypothetical protein BVC93_20310 [Mycobacterium sp. MS1601]|uniref:MmpS family transport accessory protein n=1 Tax=Mycobacterium sp. MS1601 TaxID=1936029 RepID=UPI0009794ECA|nr:MmpS family transport accessory protein [Mycobacterium sp. MS1601]AQA06554.1 hypothetical protein BVC93_20310 [Mycobacterium sp. MS1601]